MPLIKEHRLAQAENEVARTRDRLIDTVTDFADMLEPKRIMAEVWENAKDKGADLAENAVDAVRKRPVMAGGLLAAAVAWLAREPLKDAAVSAYDAMTSPKKKSGEKKAETAKPNAASLVTKPAKPRRKAPSKAKPKTVESKS